MADEQDRWLDRETAERLLSGLPPQADDPAVLARAERLARTLGALTPPPLTSEELPGEAAALAAFRKVSEERAGQITAGGADRRTTAQVSDAGLVRICAPRAERTTASRGARWTRPLRFGLAAALAAGMVGGAAALAGTGVLPGPSDGPGTDPAASVTATPTAPERHMATPPPTQGAPGGATADARPAPSGPATGPGRADGSGAPDGKATGDPAKPGADSGHPAGRFGRGWKQIASACRDLRNGKDLDGGRRRMLEGAAGSAARVETYCKGVLAVTGHGPRSGKELGTDTRERHGRDGRGGREDSDDDAGKRGGNGRPGGHGRHVGKGQGKGHGQGQDRRGGGHPRAGGGHDRGGRQHDRAAAPGQAHLPGRPGDPGPSLPIRL